MFYRFADIPVLKLLLLWKVSGKIFQKQRNLSGESQVGNERKKIKEGSSASSTDATDVFGDGSESADCKIILFNCLKILQVKVKISLICLCQIL